LNAKAQQKGPAEKVQNEKPKSIKGYGQEGGSKSGSEYRRKEGSAPEMGPTRRMAATAKKSDPKKKTAH